MARAAEIQIGFEIGTGEPVNVPHGHLAVTGQTQRSGKTTTLEALVARSGLTAISFITKRGEASFQNSYRIQPYFREQCDWQYVSAILEATLRERLKFERSWIMQVCKGATSLAGVQQNVEGRLVKATGLNLSVLTTLHAYLEIVLPQIARTKFANKVYLQPGHSHTMDLSDMRLEMQSLVIRSVVEWVYEREKNVVLVIPEAWEFIPQQRGSPVKLAVETLIRKGGTLGNYVWLDSQDLAAVHNDILRSIGVWILGVQREHNEVQRLLRHIPGKKPKADEVMQLGLGQFFVCSGRETHQVYVWPRWIADEEARRIAMDGATAPPAPQREDLKEDTEMDTRLATEVERLKGELAAAMVMISDLQEELRRERERRGAQGTPGSLGGLSTPPPLAAVPEVPTMAPTSNGSGDQETLYQYFKHRLIQEAPSILQVAVLRPKLAVAVQQKTVRVEGDSYMGRVARQIVEGLFDQPVAPPAVMAALVRIGLSPKTPKVRIWEQLQELTRMGILVKEGANYVKASGAIVEKDAVSSEG